MPKNLYAPAKCFLKLRTTIRTPNTANAAATNLTDFVLKGNSLNDWASDIMPSGSSYLGGPLYQYGQLYNKYYVYASKIKVMAFWTGSILENDTERNLYTFVSPSKSLSRYISTQINYNNSGTIGTAPEDMPNVRGRHWNQTNVFKHPIVIKNKCTTKRMFQKNTKTDDDYTGDLLSTPTSLLITCTDPVERWNWHITTLTTDNVPDPLPETYWGLYFVITMTHYVMLYARKDRLPNTTEA